VRAAVELAKDWRTDRMLRRLEALLLVGDRENTLVVSGSGEVIEPDDPVAAIGSGGGYALAAGRAKCPIRGRLQSEPRPLLPTGPDSRRDWQDIPRRHLRSLRARPGAAANLLLSGCLVLAFALLRVFLRVSAPPRQMAHSLIGSGYAGLDSGRVSYPLPRNRSISRRSRFDGLPSRNASKCGIALRSAANFSRSSRLASVSR